MATIRQILIILLSLLSFILSEDVYPNFSDPLKQLAFEKKRIYVKEESGERVLTSGGESYTELANPLGYIFLDENPAYISKNHPITSSVQYWYDFTIKQNNIELTEIDFLNIVGLNEEKNSILDNYSDQINKYYQKLDDYNSKYLLKDNVVIKEFTFNRGWLGHTLNVNGNNISYNGNQESFVSLIGQIEGSNGDDIPVEEWLAFFRWMTLLFWGTEWIYGAYDYEPDCEYWGNEYGDCDSAKRFKKRESFYINHLTISTTVSLSNLFKWKKKTKKPQLEFPSYSKLKKPTKPYLKQTLSAETIKSIAESYNRKIYKEIKNSK